MVNCKVLYCIYCKEKVQHIQIHSVHRVPFISIKIVYKLCKVYSKIVDPYIIKKF